MALKKVAGGSVNNDYLNFFHQDSSIYLSSQSKFSIVLVVCPHCAGNQGQCRRVHYFILFMIYYLVLFSWSVRHKVPHFSMVYCKISVYRDSRQESRLSGISVLGGEYSGMFSHWPYLVQICQNQYKLGKVSCAKHAGPSWRPSRLAKLLRYFPAIGARMVCCQAHGI